MATRVGSMGGMKSGRAFRFAPFGGEKANGTRLVDDEAARFSGSGSDLTLSTDAMARARGEPGVSIR